MGNLGVLESYLGMERCGLGITTYGANILEPGVVQEGGEGVVFISKEERLTGFTDWFSMSGFTVELTDDLATLVWGKLIINAAINPLTALLEVPNGDLLVRESARELMQAAAEEAANVASAAGVHLPYDDPVERVEQVARLTAQNHSSMLQDIRRGAPTEIDAISGAICREGDAQGLDTPIAWSLWQLVRAKSAQ
jgi:2-dehydropantoate 2-reductase